MANSRQPTMDVEAAIRDDKLDFGVFGPEDRLWGKMAERVIGGVREEMSKLIDTN